MRAVILLALTFVASGCCGSRTVTVEVPTRDAVNQAPPDTTLRTVPPPIDTTGTPTLPVAVDVNVSADTSAATVCVTSIVQTDSTIEIRTPTGSQTFRSPDCDSGQVATYTPRPPEAPAAEPLAPEAPPAAREPEARPPPTSFEGRVSGTPRPREVEVTCPACPTPVVGSGRWGYVKLLLLLAAAFGLGVFVGRQRT